MRWIYGASAVVFLVLGSIWILHGDAHGWIPVAGAVLVGAGLVLVAKRRNWGSLIAVWGLTTGLAWLLGLLGRDDSFPLGAWIIGTGMATVVFYQDRRKSPAQSQVGNS